MSWFKVDDRLHADDKVARLFAEHPRHAAAAMGLWVLAGSWCAQQRSDGRVPASVVRELNRRQRSTDRLTAALQSVGLWRSVGDWWEFNRWDAYNPTRAELDRKDSENRERVRRYRERGNALQENSVSASRPVPSRPVPERESARAEAVPFREVHPAPDPEPARDPVARLAGGYEDRFVRATGSPWMALGANHRWVSAVARWLEAQDGDFDENAARWLDAWFGHEPSRKHRWAWKFIAEDPGRVYGAPGERAKSADELIAKYGRGRRANA